MKQLIIPILISILFSGCGITVTSARSETKLRELDLGMDRHQVNSILGSEGAIRGAKKTGSGSELKVDEHYLYPAGTPLANFGWGFVTLGWAWFVPMKSHANAYWIQYVDGKLDKWAKAGDLTISGELTINK